MRTPAALLIGVLACAEAFAAAPLATEFAYGLEIDPRGERALWRVELPPHVYRTVTRPDLGDIRVFNGAGEPVPFAVQRRAPETGEPPSPAALAFFPVHVAPGADTSGRGVRVETDDAGTIVSVTGEPSAGETERVGAYLVDASQLEQPPERLTLDWVRGGAEGFVTEIRIDASDDLAEWRTLMPRATVADLRSGPHALTQREIELPHHDARYLRLHWPKTLREVRLTGVTARFPAPRAEPARSWHAVSGRRLDEMPAGFAFDAGGRWTVDRARVSFHAGNVVVEGRLASRPEPGAAWRTRHRGVFFRLARGEGVVTSDAVDITPTTDRYWRLEAQSMEGESGDIAPELELRIVPHDVTFVARGAAPYVIAYGNRDAGPAGQPVDALLRDIDRADRERLVGRVEVDRRVTLGGIERTRPPAAPLPWKRWALWAVLVGGVVLLAGMVRRLAREMGDAS